MKISIPFYRYMVNMTESEVKKHMCNLNVFEKTTRGDAKLKAQLIQMYLKVSKTVARAISPQYVRINFQSYVAMHYTNL